MRDNKRILQEAFFKKESFADKLKRKMPQYEPLDVKQTAIPGIGGITADTNQGNIVTDIDEAKKRLVGAFGASIGVNTVKNMASRSIKSFPIIVSDNVDPETSVMLKRLTEEQYAEYINLLISNQVIDISDFKSGEEGNVAIQALDVISGADFGKQKLAKKALSGELTADDFFKNFSAYNLIRQESKEYKTGTPLFDALLENAIITTPEDAEKLTEYMINFSEEFTQLLEIDARERDEKSSKYVRLRDLLSDEKILNHEGARDRDQVFDIARGYEKVDYSKEIKTLDSVIDDLDRKASVIRVKPLNARSREEIESLDRMEKDLTNFNNTKLELARNINNPGSFKKMTTTDILLDKNEAKKALDSSVGEILMDPKNDIIRDRFEKATFLLEARKIAGIEWIEYLINRLGLPVRNETRKNILTEYPVRDVITTGDGVVGNRDYSRGFCRADAIRVASSRSIRTRALLPTLVMHGKDLLKSIAYAGVAGGAAWAGAAGALALLSLAIPLIPILAGAAVGGFTLIRKLIVNRRKYIGATSTRGWERVEMLIADMEAQQKNLRMLQRSKDELEYNSKDNKEKKELAPQFLALSGDELKAELDKYSKEMANLYRESKKEDVRKKYSPAIFKVNESYDINQYLDKDILTEAFNFGKKLEEELANDKDYQAKLLSEAIIGTKTPTTTNIQIKLRKQYEYDKKAKPEILVAPAFSSRSAYAYGSVEYDKRELKDRKYNAPLIMKISFKERFSDEKFSDNELVAVIGILGVITRVPSEEMKYILKSNVQGDTLKGIFKAEGSMNNIISDLLGVTKIKKDVESLPQSGEVWQNLEKIARLAVSNKLAGKQSNNIANAHLVFSQKEVDDVRADINVDYLKDKRLSADLMKRYSAFTLMIANDVSERLYIFDDPDSISWNVIPYSAIRNKDTGDQLTSALAKMASQQR